MGCFSHCCDIEHDQGNIRKEDGFRSGRSRLWHITVKKVQHWKHQLWSHLIYSQEVDRGSAGTQLASSILFSLGSSP